MIRFALAALSMLIATATNANKEFNNIVAETLTIEDYSEWLRIQQSFQAKETREKERFISCIEKGTNKKTCVDPHWCLYPDKLNKEECVWYKIKYDIQ